MLVVLKFFLIFWLSLPLATIIFRVTLRSSIKYVYIDVSIFGILCCVLDAGCWLHSFEVYPGSVLCNFLTDLFVTV